MLATGSQDHETFDTLRREWRKLVAEPTWDDELRRLKEEWSAVAWQSGGKTLLAALGVQYQEVPLCRGLAWLLDPQGGHQFGRLFLDAFLTSLDLAPSGDAPISIRVEEGRADTRADIVVRVGGQTVVIEAKVFAGEQLDQADRLYELWRSEGSRWVFLTKTGYAPYTAHKSADHWTTLTWRSLAELARRTAEDAEVEPSHGAYEFIQTISRL